MNNGGVLLGAILYVADICYHRHQREVTAVKSGFWPHPTYLGFSQDEFVTVVMV